jgi:hypothetical protein
MKTPDSMKAELSAWNNDGGIDLESWIGCEGSFSLAVGYATVFWPEFVEFDGYILSKGFSEDSLRGFERQQAGNRKSVEWLMNHLHILYIHYSAKDASKDKSFCWAMWSRRSIRQSCSGSFRIDRAL